MRESIEPDLEVIPVVACSIESCTYRSLTVFSWRGEAFVGVLVAVGCVPPTPPPSPTHFRVSLSLPLAEMI